MMEQADLKGIRFDKSLMSFAKLWNLFIDSEKRIKNSEKRLIAKWRLFPPEIIYALGATPYDLILHGGVTETTNKDMRVAGFAVESGLSADSCPWNLEATGKILSQKDANSVDMFLATAGQCDVSSKSWQIMSRNTRKPLYSMEIPMFNANSEKRAISFIQKELTSLFTRLSRRFERKYSEATLHKEIKRGNKIRQLLLDLTNFLSIDQPPLSALEYFLAHTTAGDYLQDPELLATSLTEIKQEAEMRIKEGKQPIESPKTPVRIYYVGMAPQDFRFWNMLEDSGGMLVGCDTYLPLFYDLIPENGSILGNFAKWMWMMPHHMQGSERARTLTKYIKQQKPNAIIIGNVIGCRSLSSSDRILKETLRDELGIPITSVEFGSSEDVTLLEPHVKAFIEMCK